MAGEINDTDDESGHITWQGGTKQGRAALERNLEGPSRVVITGQRYAQIVINQCGKAVPHSLADRYETGPQQE